jgi:hypothetical protein
VALAPYIHADISLLQSLFVVLSHSFITRASHRHVVFRPWKGCTKQCPCAQAVHRHLSFVSCIAIMNVKQISPLYCADGSILAVDVLLMNDIEAIDRDRLGGCTKAQLDGDLRPSRGNLLSQNGE